MEIKKYNELDNETLAKAFHILYGQCWKQRFTVNDKAREMRSIFNGGTQPCVPFQSWINLIKFLNTQIS